ncbi:MAG TPA: SDR family NAD(P)-dependent oxidoreductase, partial [Dehalococcoidia bacterium]|nr:SDR family NAD(P)-dependent oxidoreductase [Dehalococcoidia bacterium]
MVQSDVIKSRQAEMVERAIEQARDIAGRVAVVTGGARGLGRAMSEGLLKAGAKVAVADKSWDGADDLRQQLISSGRGLAVELDVTNDAQLDSAYDAVIGEFGTTDVLINNAALVSETLFYPTGRVKTLDTKDSDWETMFRVNVFGVVKAIRRFIRPMIEQGRGSILNVVSSGVLPVAGGGGWFGLRPWTVEMPYQATKAAVMALTF